MRLVIAVCGLVVAIVMVGLWAMNQRGEPVTPVVDESAQTPIVSGQAIADDLMRFGLIGEEATTASPSVSEWSTVALDADTPFVDQLSALEAAAVGNAEVAMTLASAWQLCRFHTGSGDAANLARNLAGLQLQLAEAELAQVADTELRELGAQALAQVDPRELVAEMTQNVARRDAFCAGTEQVPSSDRMDKSLHWLQQAAEQGDADARRALVTAAFDQVEVVLANTSRLARMKPVVLRTLSQGLASGDGYMLGEMAVFTASGHFALPDPERGLAYALAYLSRMTAGSPAGMARSEFRLRRFAMIQSLANELTSQLDGTQQQRAQSLASQLALCCTAGVVP